MALRLFRIGWAIAALLIFAARHRLRPQPEVSIADRLRLTLERLGPTFVKLGQALSLRRDVLPDEYVAALHQLQDHVASFPGALARREVERELGRPIEAIFADFEDEPLAAASIAQVHRARLDDGAPVIVKVRRPGIRAQIDRDMRILLAILRLAVILAPRLQKFQPVELVKEANMRRRSRRRTFRRCSEPGCAGPSARAPDCRSRSGSRVSRTRSCASSVPATGWRSRWSRSGCMSPPLC